MVFPDRTTERTTNLVSLKGKLGLLYAANDRFIEEVARIQIFVANKFKPFTMPIIASGAGGDVHCRPRIATVLGAGRGIINLELRDRINRWLEGDLAVGHVIQV